jgi:hypothetical protein
METPQVLGVPSTHDFRTNIGWRMLLGSCKHATWLVRREVCMSGHALVACIGIPQWSLKHLL